MVRHKTHRLRPATESQTIARLRALRENAGYVFVEQVRERTGLDAGRSADALGLSIYPSRGLYVEGYEIKCSRGDWKTELASPEKSSGFIGFCRHWWLVCGTTGIAEQHEIPATWGWMEWNGSRLVTRRPAPALECEPPTLEFVSAILRRGLQLLIPASSVREKIDEAYKRGKADGIAEGAYNYDREHKELLELRELHSKMETALGCSLSDWNAEEILRDIKVGRSLERFCQPSDAPFLQRMGNDAIALATRLADFAKVLAHRNGDIGHHDADLH